MKRIRIKIYCKKCKNYKDEDDVKFINIEEDIQGADVLTFECPDCNYVLKSRRYDIYNATFFNCTCI